MVECCGQQQAVRPGPPWITWGAQTRTASVALGPVFVASCHLAHGLAFSEAHRRFKPSAVCVRVGQGLVGPGHAEQ